MLNLYRSAGTPKGIEESKFLCCPLSGLFLCFRFFFRKLTLSLCFLLLLLLSFFLCNTPHILFLDYGDTPLVEEYEKCTTHIEKAVSSEENILIHCEGGINRAPTMTVIYLFSCEKYSLRDAVYLVKKKREQARPHLGYLKQLERLESRIKKENSMTLDELVALFEPVDVVAANTATGISAEIWSSILEDYGNGRLQENIEKLTPSQKMVLMNIACKIQALVVANT